MQNMSKWLVLIGQIIQRDLFRLYYIRKRRPNDRVEVTDFLVIGGSLYSRLN